MSSKDCSMWTLFICTANKIKTPTTTILVVYHIARISTEEREYIERSQATSSEARHVKRRIPWRSIATSLPMWAIIVCDIGNSYSLMLFMTMIPTYLNNVMGFSIKKVRSGTCF